MLLCRWRAHLLLCSLAHEQQSDSYDIFSIASRHYLDGPGTLTSPREVGGREKEEEEEEEMGAPNGGSESDCSDAINRRR